ncbi:fructosamine kinase family protein [Actinotalea sp. C106]|uniref:fructosamine kinase family protein n=1 Tax=Actinotalea sp. C106 TaxID=2908644 RepID=UPI00202957CB|nr:fructosamine kinase family protein [Actinotalea sp. C106]
MEIYRKERTGAPPGFFACEAAGLRWLAASGGARVVEVLGADEHGLDLEALVPTSPSVDHAQELGRRLAQTHAAGAADFGGPPEGWEGDGFFGPLSDPYPLALGRWPRWGLAHAEGRVLPLRDHLDAQGALGPGLATRLDRLAERLRDGLGEDDDPPSRLHGDLWSGNVMWTAQGATLIDPAAHGGHRLGDLAMLELFGLPHLGEVLSAYEEQWPLATGWRDLVGLHQIYPVGMHAVLFGGSYRDQLVRLVDRYV